MTESGQLDFFSLIGIQCCRGDSPIALYVECLHQKVNTMGSRTTAWKWLAAMLVLTSVLCGCNDHPLRGTVMKSSDGKTYLAVIDDNGGHCGPLKVDGFVWPYKISQPGQVQPGHHSIECGGAISFDIPKGVIFRFTYWGP